MILTVKECLKIATFKKAVTLAGKKHLDRHIKSLSVMDTSDPKEAAARCGAKDRMVLTSFSGMEKNYGAQVDAVKNLAASGVGCLVVFSMGFPFPSGFNKVYETAESEGLPMILMPEEAEYSQVIDQVMDKLLVSEDDSHNLINNTIYHLLDFDKHRTFQDALKVAAISNEFQVVLVSKDFNPVLVVENRHSVTVIDAIRDLRRSEASGQRSVYSSLSIEGIAAYWGTIYIEGEEYFLLLVDNAEQYSAVDITKLAEIIELAMGMWRFTPERDAKVELIQSLMRGNLALAHTLQEEIGVGKDRRVGAVFYAKGMDSPSAVSAIEKYEKKTGVEILRVTEGDESYGVIIFPAAKLQDQDAMPIDTLYKDLKDAVDGIKVFHFGGISDLESAAEGFNLIGETWHFVEKVFPYKRIITKYEMMLVSNCIDLQVRSGRIKRNYTNLLKPFGDMPREGKAEQLLSTLETFVLDAGMNSNKTARIMGVHANTIQYRLKKIHELLGVDITGNRVIPALTVALALHRMELETE